MFQQYLPHITVESLWISLDRIGLPNSAQTTGAKRKLAIHDSCTTRNDANLHNSIRSILDKLGCEQEELPFHREQTVCCGYGGLMMFANKEIARKVVSRRVKESETDYLAYCSMCRDNFAGQGKRTYHLLDLLFGSEPDVLAGQEGPGYSQRQENRAKLKRSLLRDCWGEMVAEPEAKMKLIIPDNVRQVLEDRMILDDDIRKVIENGE